MDTVQQSDPRYHCPKCGVNEPVFELDIPYCGNCGADFPQQDNSPPQVESVTIEYPQSGRSVTLTPDELHEVAHQDHESLPDEPQASKGDVIPHPSTIISNMTEGPFRVYKTGVQIEGRPPLEVYYSFTSGVQAVNKAVQFAIGDLLNFGEEAYGEDFPQVYNLFPNYDYQTVANIKSICKKVPFSLRRESLTFSHHALVAKMDEVDQDHWLRKAEAEGWTVREMRAAIKEEAGEPDKPTTYNLKLNESEALWLKKEITPVASVGDVMALAILDKVRLLLE